MCSTLLDATHFFRKIMPVLQSHQQCLRVTVDPFSFQNLMSDFPFSSSLMGMYPIVVLICTSLITKGRAPFCLLIDHLGINFCIVSIILPIFLFGCLSHQFVIVMLTRFC